MPQAIPTPLAHFTNREPQKAAFDALWSNSSHWVVVYTGVSGHGKSSLIDWLIVHRCQPRPIPWIKIDLHGGLNPVNVLDNLADLLPDSASQRYRARRDTITDNHLQSRRRLLEAAATRPIQATQQASDGGQISQANIHIQTGLAQDQADLTELYHHQLTAALCAELSSLPTGPTVIFVDTYEQTHDDPANPPDSRRPRELVYTGHHVGLQATRSQTRVLADRARCIARAQQGRVDGWGV